MQNGTKRSTRRKLLLVVLAVGALLAGLILLRGAAGDQTGADRAEGRLAFAGELGWELDPESEEHHRIVLPKELGGVLDDYNQLQLKSGYDLSPYLGKACDQYSYRIVNYPDSSQTVLLTLYVRGGKIIAGDIHSTALDGFMTGLCEREGT